MTTQLPADLKPRDGYVWVLRVCAPDMTSRGGMFRWPASGPVKAPDWDSISVCGGGLHGWLWGGGNLDYASDADHADGARWLVVEVLASDVVGLTGKVKFPSAVVVFCGERGAAVALIQRCAPSGTAVIYSTSTSGEHGASISGDCGTSTSGYYGTSTSGNRGMSTSGDHGTSTSGDRGTSTSGWRGMSISGDCGTSISGIHGTSISGCLGTAQAGEKGTIAIKRWDATRSKCTLVVGDIGFDGLLPDVQYVLNAEGKFMRKE